MEDLSLIQPDVLHETHDLTLFKCGITNLDNWLRQRALRNQLSGASVTYVVSDTQKRVVAFYSLSSGTLGTAEAPGWLRRNMPNPIPMVLLGRLAIDQAYQSRGLGTALLQDAVLRAQAASRILGVRGLLVHALSEDAKRFYVRNGFVEIMPGAMTLVLSLALSNEASAQT